MTKPASHSPSEIDELLALVRDHHRRLHEWRGREPLVTTEGSGARCVGVRCHLELALFDRLERFLAAQGLATRCCTEEELAEALRQGWRLVHLQPEFGGVELVVEEQLILCREA
ncbi:MAG: hypothetical protein ACE5KY_02480 [Candidatus Tectimicrobiota bacterium]